MSVSNTLIEQLPFFSSMARLLAFGQTHMHRKLCEFGEEISKRGINAVRKTVTSRQAHGLAAAGTRSDDR
jgi:hypothetical protein